MGFKDFMAKQLKNATKAGEVNGADFPLGTYINFGSEEGENYMLFTYPNETEEKIYHDMVKCATVLAMGVTEIQKDSKGGTTMIYGTKYLCVFKDGRQAVLTVGLGKTQYKVERILF